MTQSYSFQTLVFSLLLTSFVIASTPAYSRPESMNLAETRQESQVMAPTVQLKGELFCNLGNENNGQSCQLKLRENTTGKVYMLNEHTPTLRLFYQGARKVAIQGTLSSDSTLNITQSEAN